jgi:hypothetical protein
MNALLAEIAIIHYRTFPGAIVLAACGPSPADEDAVYGLLLILPITIANEDRHTGADTPFYLFHFGL